MYDEKSQHWKRIKLGHSPPPVPCTSLLYIHYGCANGSSIRKMLCHSQYTQRRCIPEFQGGIVSLMAMNGVARFETLKYSHTPKFVSSNRQIYMSSSHTTYMNPVFWEIETREALKCPCVTCTYVLSGYYYHRTNLCILLFCSLGLLF